MATTTVTTTKGNKSTSVTTTNESPGKAWVKGAKGKWVKPPVPKKAGVDYAWDDNDGWVSKEAQAESYRQEAYALPLAVISKDESLTTLFNQAWASMKAGTEWSKEEFLVALKSTKWYMERSEAQRKYFALSNDPSQVEEFNKQIGNERSRVAALAAQYGASMTDAQIDELTRTSLRDGLKDTDIAELIPAYINYATQDIKEVAGSLFGKAGNVEDTIRDWAKRNGTTVSDSWVLDQVRNSTKGGFDPSKAKDEITKMAKDQYSHWSDRLDGLTTLDDLAAGFKNIVSQEMDIDFTTLGMDNKWVQQAMSAKDDKGRPIVGDALRKTLYKTDEWASVKKNTDKIVATGRDILTRMGF
jgi:hypothetical protein